MKLTTTPRSIFSFLLSASLLLGGTTAIAAANNGQYNIQTKIFMDGNLLSSPRLVVKENKKASLYSADYLTRQHNQVKLRGHALKLDIVANRFATENSKDAIKVSYDISYENGNEKMHSKPVIVLRPNQVGAVEFKNKSGHVYKIETVVTG